MSFEAWALPWSFRLRSGEAAALQEGRGSAVSYPVLSGDRLRQLLEVLRNAGDLLHGFPLSRILPAVDETARRFLDPNDALREEALEAMAAQGGYSDPMVREILDGMARGWTRPILEALLHAEFPHPEMLDGLHPSRIGGDIRASGYPLAFHLGAGTVPGVSTTSLIRSLMVKTPVLLRPGRGDVPLSVLFARALQEVDPEVGGAVAVLYWPGDGGGGTEVALEEADLVVVYGGNDTVRWVRERIPATTAMVAYRHRMGVALIGRQALAAGSGLGSAGPARATPAPGTAREAALAAARAVALFDQRGCVSPHVILVEEGGEVDPEAWAGLLAGALEGLEEDLPSAPPTPEEGAVIQQLRGEAEMEESLGRCRVFHGGTRAPWTVLFQPDGRLEPSCLNRVVRVIPVPRLKDALPLLAEWRLHLQTVGIAGLGGGRRELLDGLIRLGVSRVVGLADVPWPSPWSHHDGAGPLQALVRWTDVEGV